MYNYIKGKVVEQGNNYIVVDNREIGYQIYVANPFSFELEKEYCIYLYNHVKEEEFSLYGFKVVEEKEFFLKLINVKGLGPKMAISMFATGNISGIVDAIQRENLLYLTKFPKIGEKLAKQIILDLKGKLKSFDNSYNSSTTSDELMEVLLSLGYKSNDLKRVVPMVDTKKAIEDQIKEALKFLLK